MNIGGETILQLGDPRLHRPCKSVDPQDPDLAEYEERLISTLLAFRHTFGFGRAIAAPQIGIDRRMVAATLEDGPFVMLNPEITWRSRDVVTLWDDCMSFPMLLVGVERHRSVSLEYTSAAGTLQVLERVGTSLSELFQHELDHLDGVLAIDRALDKRSLVSRSVFEEMKPMFEEQVSYLPTAEASGPD